ncbi:MAG: diguanylate cyclase (GGDEF)-like protein [Paraglaciecola sp.]|jgi:diguanylate cyclase (GGDEF)-like protein
MQNLGKHFLPPLILFTGVCLLYQMQTELLAQWFEKLNWLNYASLAVTASVALQFGRSRLVLCCLLLLFLILPIENWLYFDNQFSSRLGLIIMLQVCWLLYSKDRGFAAINLILSLLPLTLIALFGWFGLPYISQLSQDLLAPLHSFLYQMNPQLNAMFTPFEWLIAFSVLVLALIRTLSKIDNNRSALFFTVLVLSSIQIQQDLTFTRICIFSLASFYAYAVLRDSFNMAFKDELTEIPSRRALMQFAQTLGRKYTLVMCDIDHFKKFNDSYGHDVGDEVLRLIASKLNQVSGGGKAFRYGGEEFVIVFPRKEIENVVPYIEQLRQIIADYSITIRTKPRPAKAPNKNAKKTVNGKTISITCSFGVAERTSETTEFNHIMKHADIALYAAKKAGRNCVQKAKQ